MDRLWRDLAIAAGVGVRLDFSFFLIRFDLGARVKDPGEEQPEKTNPRLFNELPVLNFGIGYPF